MQFNLDILGNEELQAELDVFLVLRRIMKSLGATGDRYSIRYSSRRLATEVLGRLGLDREEAMQAYGVIDKRDKMKPEEWKNWAESTILDPEKSKGIVRFASCSDLTDPWLVDLVGESDAYGEITSFSGMLDETGVVEASFEACVVRGLDYYTGIVFELMDTGGENRRAICGGGRYDDLVSMFGGQRISGVGFGLGLLTLQLFLETYGLVPEEISARPPADIFMAVYSEGERSFATRLAEELRDSGVSVEMDLSGKNLSRQLRTANRKTIPFAAVIGPDEMSSGNITLKRMSTGEDIVCQIRDIPGLIEGERG
jgi:histidyl-tRNA synthetase